MRLSELLPPSDLLILTMIFIVILLEPWVNQLGLLNQLPQIEGINNRCLLSHCWRLQVQVQGVNSKYLELGSPSLACRYPFLCVYLCPNLFL